MKMNTIIIAIGLLLIGILNTVYVLTIDTTVEPMELREFNSVVELGAWLLTNDIDNNTYINNTYDCEDFAMDLVDSAIQDGYLVYSMGSGTAWVMENVVMYDAYSDTFYYGTEFVELTNHAYCVTKINNIWFMIEPQNDVITELGTEF